jgi:serine/threonine protein kinase
MPRIDPRIDFDAKAPPFDRFKSIHLLASNRRGHVSLENARHRLYVGSDRKTHASVLLKIAARPGLTYQHNLANEIACLSKINESLPQSVYFPVLRAHGKLADGRLYLITSLFHEFPLANAIGGERIPARSAAYLRTAMEIANALEELHGLRIYHVDLNPMNVLVRLEHGKSITRIVDFESSYDCDRHSTGTFYDPPVTPGFAAPEIARQQPDARSDVFSLGAVHYTMLAGYGWTWGAEVWTSVHGDRDLDPDLKGILLRAVDPDPGSRYPNIHEFRSNLAGYLDWLWRVSPTSN